MKEWERDTVEYRGVGRVISYVAKVKAVNALRLSVQNPYSSYVTRKHHEAIGGRKWISLLGKSTNAD